MKGNTINEFISDLYANGGPEKEIRYFDKYYIIQCDNSNSDLTTILRVDEYKYLNNEVTDFIETFIYIGITLAECVNAFEKAEIFGNKTIYEAEKDIEVLFG